jgi:tetratricopeptide (TPR) repeat protein
VLALALSLYHTVPWIALNTSELRSLERIKSLPLGLGRTQLVVGNWYLRRKDLPAARSWLEKSLQENPGNVGTLDILAGVYYLMGEKPRAFETLAVAIRMRPDDAPMHVKMTRMLVAERRYMEALPHFEQLERLRALEPDDWIRYGEALRSVGRADDARRAFETALELDPNHPRKAAVQQWISEMR